MFVALGSIAFLALFTTMPLAWLKLGVPWMPLVITFFVIPLLDAAVGARTPNPFIRVHPALARWIPRAQVPLQAVVLVAAVLTAPSLSWSELVLFALAVGTVTGGVGITIAHELCHRANALDRTLAKVLLLSVAYGHFVVEHVRGHHVRVATLEDPATAPRGMNVYRFVLRSACGSFAHAWQLEAMRLSRLRRSAWHASNWVLSGTAMAAGLAVLAAGAGGTHGLVLFLLQAIWAVILLEVVNYIEHYGLVRRRVGARYEPVDERHSWSADFTVSNWMLFNLQLHSDHHARMQQPYEALQSVAAAPRLPLGYPALVPVALLPALWFSLMDSRLPQEVVA